MNDKNSVLIGFVIGAIVPVAGYVVIEFIFDMVTQLGWMDSISMSTGAKRIRTMALLAICCNLIPVQIGKAKRWDNNIKGVVFATLIYVGAWIYMFHGQIFS